MHEAVIRAQVQKEARHAFGALLDRVSASECLFVKLCTGLRV